jgi:hypothetical protein
MLCTICRELERALASRSLEYVTASSALYCRISSKFVAYDVVEMERAKSDLETHRSVCATAIGAAKQVLKRRSAPPKPLLPTR